MSEDKGLVVRVASWCLQHRRRVLIAWVAVLVAALAATSGLGTRAANQFSLGGTESQRVQDVLTRAFPAQSGDVDQVVFRAREGRITDAAVRARIAPVLARTGRRIPESALSSSSAPCTVEWHLRKVFAKLGISSRRELRSVLPDANEASLVDVDAI